MMGKQISHILLVDDDSSHRLLSRKALLSLPGKPLISEHADVKNTIEFLTANSHDLSLAVIDFNLGHVKGTAIVEWLRANNHYASVPIIMISTSHLATDFEEAYAVGANCFLYKNETIQIYHANLTSAAQFLTRVPSCCP